MEKLKFSSGTPTMTEEEHDEAKAIFGIVCIIFCIVGFTLRYVFV